MYSGYIIESVSLHHLFNCSILIQILCQRFHRFTDKHINLLFIDLYVFQSGLTFFITFVILTGHTVICSYCASFWQSSDRVID